MLLSEQHFGATGDETEAAATQRRAAVWDSRAVNAAIGRAQVSFGAVWASESAFMVGLAVVAFRDGGVGALGVVTAVRMAVAALVAPWLATVADRVRREWVLTAVGVVRAVCLGVAAVVTGVGGPAVITYILAVVATVAFALFRPAHSALLPALCTSPEQLTRANAVRGLLDSSATLGGPAAAAVLLAVSGPAAVFGVCAGASLLGGVVVLGLAYDAPPRAAPDAQRRRVGQEVLQGFRTIAADRGLSLITGLGVVQTFTRGCLTVLTVVIAIDLLGLANSGVGVLTAAVGAGGMVGSLFAFGLVGRGRLALWFGVGVALFGAPLVLVGALPHTATTIVLLAVVGIGNALIDVAGFTLLARLADETVLARMFAGFEAILTLGVAAGSLVTPVLLHVVDTRAALVVVGLLAPAAVLASRPVLRRLDAQMRVRDADIETLRAVPMLEALPVATIEQLAAALEHAAVKPGATLVRQGDRGEFFYILRAGSADVLQDGRRVRTLAAGDCFGEIALLHDVPRTATVQAATNATDELGVSRLSRGAFLTAVTGYPAAATAGETLATRRLSDDADRSATRRGSGAAPALQAQHVGQPAPGDAERPADPLERSGLWQRGQ